MESWARNGVESWFEEGWLELDVRLSQLMSPILGAKPECLTFPSGLTENVHKLIATFYKPKGKRNKILALEKEFPSDIYAIAS